MLQIRSHRPDAKQTHNRYVTETDDTFHFFRNEISNKAQPLITSDKDRKQMMTYLNISIC